MTGATQTIRALLIGHQDKNVRSGHGPDYGLAQVYLAMRPRSEGHRA
jgi:hypothetical protein